MHELICCSFALSLYSLYFLLSLLGNCVKSGSTNEIDLSRWSVTKAIKTEYMQKGFIWISLFSCFRILWWVWESRRGSQTWNSFMEKVMCLTKMRSRAKIQKFIYFKLIWTASVINWEKERSISEMPSSLRQKLMMEYNFGPSLGYFLFVYRTALVLLLKKLSEFWSQNYLNSLIDTAETLRCQAQTQNLLPICESTGHSGVSFHVHDTFFNLCNQLKMIFNLMSHLVAYFISPNPLTIFRKIIRFFLTSWEESPYSPTQLLILLKWKFYTCLCLLWCFYKVQHPLYKAATLPKTIFMRNLAPMPWEVNHAGSHDAYTYQKKRNWLHGPPGWEGNWDIS